VDRLGDQDAAAIARGIRPGSALLAPEEDEFVYAELTPAQAVSIDAPYVAESLLVYECKLERIISFGDEPGAGSLILGKVNHIHVDDSIYQEDGRIDFAALDPIGRLAGTWYSTIRDRFEMQRG
jgi:flavin reductase (DIM6/NTAB) family NADH-FMN oxidoreductase RutF